MRDRPVDRREAEVPTVASEVKPPAPPEPAIETRASGQLLTPPPPPWADAATALSGGPAGHAGLVDTVASPEGGARRAIPLDEGGRIVSGGRIGRYLVISQIGQGGMGEVFSAFDDELDRRVALKVVRARMDGSLGQARMKREAQALARLSHPNVVHVYDVGDHEGQVFLAMEFVKGVTLREWQEGHDPEDPAGQRAIIDMYIQAGRGLAAAHAAGIVHRDFKPKSRSPRPERPQLADRLQSPEFGRSGRGAAGSSRLWVPRDASDLGKPRAKPRSTPGGIKARSTMGRTLGQRRETCSTPGGIKARSTPTRRPR